MKKQFLSFLLCGLVIMQPQKVEAIEPVSISLIALGSVSAAAALGLLGNKAYVFAKQRISQLRGMSHQYSKDIHSFSKLDIQNIGTVMMVPGDEWKVEVQTIKENEKLVNIHQSANGLLSLSMQKPLRKKTEEEMTDQQLIERSTKVFVVIRYKEAEFKPSHITVAEGSFVSILSNIKTPHLHVQVKQDGVLICSKDTETEFCNLQVSEKGKLALNRLSVKQRLIGTISKNAEVNIGELISRGNGRFNVSENGSVMCAGQADALVVRLQDRAQFNAAQCQARDVTVDIQHSFENVNVNASKTLKFMGYRFAKPVYYYGNPEITNTIETACESVYLPFGLMWFSSINNSNMLVEKTEQSQKKKRRFNPFRRSKKQQVTESEMQPIDEAVDAIMIAPELQKTDKNKDLPSGHVGELKEVDMSTVASAADTVSDVVPSPMMATEVDHTLFV